MNYCCGNCIYRDPEDGYCVQLVEIVDASQAACEDYANDSNTPISDWDNNEWLIY